MQAKTYFSFPHAWCAQDLADAVPPRLHTLIDFDALRDGPGIRSANSVDASRRPRRGAPYAMPAAFNAAFRVR